MSSAPTFEELEQELNDIFESDETTTHGSSHARKSETGLESRSSNASGSASKGALPHRRRRPSMDWPLSREEKKCCAMQLYERDVQTANELLESKDEALHAAKMKLKEKKEEIKELRRASTASTTATGTRSSFGESPVDRKEIDVTENPPTQDHNSVNDTAKAASPPAAPATASPPAAPATADIPVPRRLSGMGTKPRPQPRESSKRNASPCRQPAMQRSSSLEVFSTNVQSWWSEAMPQAQEGGDRIGSPRRRGAHQRSSSLEKIEKTPEKPASSIWGSAWKGVRNVARGVTQTATETARILTEEARTVADEMRDIGRFYQDPGTGLSNGKPKQVLADFIEWFVDFEPDTGSTGLELEHHVKGAPWRVVRVTKGLAVDTWNADAVPVTVYLYPGRREKVMRRMVVRPGDELFAVDGEPLMPDHDLQVECDARQSDITSVRRVRQCQALTFRRKIPQKLAQKVSAEGSE